MADRSTLLGELEASRETFQDVLADVDAELVTAPGVVGEWSVRDVVHHLAKWCEHASEAIDLARDGRAGDFAYSTTDTDAMNERFVSEARGVSPADALALEEIAFKGFRARVAAIDEALLGLELGNGDTVAEVIVYDGPEHYAEHAEHLRAWFGDDDADAELG